MAAVLRTFGIDLSGDGTQQIRCPVHEDRSPSARFYAEEQRVYCFTCGKGWNPLTLAMARLNFDRSTAKQWLVRTFGVIEQSTAEQVRGTLQSKRNVTSAQLDARLNALDGEVRAHAPDAKTAVLWWMGIDTLRADLHTGARDVAPLVDKLKGKIYAGTPTHHA